MYEKDVRDRAIELYIYGKSLVLKWVVTLVGYPLIAAMLSGIMMLFV